MKRRKNTGKPFFSSGKRNKGRRNGQRMREGEKEKTREAREDGQHLLFSGFLCYNFGERRAAGREGSGRLRSFTFRGEERWRN